MRLTINIPDGLLEEVMALAACDSKTETIVRALRAEAARLRQAQLRALRGQSTIVRPPPQKNIGESSDA